MEKFSVYEELITEYTFADDKPSLLFEVEADSHDEAYRAFVQAYPHKARSQVVVRAGSSARYVDHTHDASARVYGRD